MFNMIEEILEKELTFNQKDYIAWGSDTTNAIVDALNWAFINGTNTIATNHYASQPEYSVKVIANITYALSDLGYINSIVKSKWAEIQLLPNKIRRYRTDTEIHNYRMAARVDDMIMTLGKGPVSSDITKCGKDFRDTGLVRTGFAKVARNEFALDTDMIAKYYPFIVQNLVKSMTKAKSKNRVGLKYLNDSVNYEQVAQTALDVYLASPDQHYNFEDLAMDRGRAVYAILKRVFNPVASKDARACLRMPTITVSLDNKVQMNDIYYFIAELTGSKGKSEAAKYFSGLRAYKQRTLPNLDLSTEHDRKELHEQIWLERIYDKLAELDASPTRTIDWNIPLEVDASMLTK